MKPRDLVEGDGSPAILYTNYTSTGPGKLFYFYSFMKKKSLSSRSEWLLFYFILKSSQCAPHFSQASRPLLFPGDIATFWDPDGCAAEI